LSLQKKLKNMEEIKVNRIAPFRAKFYSPEGKFIGRLNEYEMNDLRCQIKRNQTEGYYCLFEDRKIHFDKNGRSNHWPNGFYDLNEKYLRELIGI
jgi:hypothetical protein